MRFPVNLNTFLQDITHIRQLGLASSLQETLHDVQFYIICWYASCCKATVDYSKSKTVRQYIIHVHFLNWLAIKKFAYATSCQMHITLHTCILDSNKLNCFMAYTCTSISTVNELDVHVSIWTLVICFTTPTLEEWYL